MNSKYRKAVFIVTYSVYNNKIYYLVLKRKLHWKGWEFPKGGIDFPESKKSAVKRELKEETNLVPIKIKKFNFSGKYKYKKVYPDRTKFIGQDYSLYSVEVKKEKVKIDEREHSDYKWLDFKQALKKLTFPNQKESLKIVNDWLNSQKTTSPSEKKAKIKFREKIIPELGTKLLLGKDRNSNDMLMEKFKGKSNTIIHTQKPGSPFCVIENNLNPSKEEIYSSGIVCARYSQDWRDNKKDIIVHTFTGKDISKKKGMQPGTWEVKRLRKEKIKKQDIINFEQKK